MSARARSRSVWLAVAALAPAAAARAGGPGWPQWLGPGRNCVVPEGALPAAWPRGGPKLLWEAPCGEGCSTPVVTGTRVIVMDRHGDRERIVCLSAGDGRELWKIAYEETHDASRKWGQGARSTPATDGRLVWCLGISGQLTCAAVGTGSVLWRKRPAGPKLRHHPPYGAYSNPLLAGDVVIVGRPRSPAIVAFEKRTGEEAWTALSTGDYFSTPVCAEVAGRSQVVALVSRHVAGLEPRTGAVLWKHPLPKAIDAFCTPAVHRDVVFINGYGMPGIAVKVTREAAGYRTAEAWRTTTARAWFNAAAARGGRMYVPSQAYRQPFLFCLEMETGRELWKLPIRGLGSKVASWVIVSGERLLVQLEDGRLILGRDGGDRFVEAGRGRILSETAFAMPAVVAGRLYARDFQRVVCLDLRAPAGPPGPSP